MSVHAAQCCLEKPPQREGSLPGAMSQGCACTGGLLPFIIWAMLEIKTPAALHEKEPSASSSASRRLAR